MQEEGSIHTSGKTPYSKYSRFLYNVARPDLMHKQIAQQRSGNMQTIPQYLYSYMELSSEAS